MNGSEAFVYINITCMSAISFVYVSSLFMYLSIIDKIMFMRL